MQRFGVGILGGGVPAGFEQIGHGLFVLPGQFIVFGDQTCHFFHAAAALFTEPGGYLGMVITAQAFEHTLIGHLTQGGMFEEIFLGILEDRLVTEKDHFAFIQAGKQRLHLLQFCPACGGLVQMLHHLIPEYTPYNRSLLQYGVLFGRQAVQARLEQAGQRFWHMNVMQAFHVHLPGVFSFDDHPIIDQHLDHFFEIIGVALCVSHQQLAQFGGQVGDLL